MLRRIVPLLMSTLLLAAPAVAGTGEKGDFELGVFGGVTFPDDYQSGSNLFNPDQDLHYGVRVGYFFNPRWSLEVSGQFFSTETDIPNISSSSNSDVDITSVRLNLLHNFRPGETIRPFITLGGGYERTDIDRQFEEDDPSYNIGTGVRWYVSDTFGLRWDARYVSTHVGSILGTRQYNFETSLGALWSVGGQPPRDSDGDGVFDRKDDCPDTPRGARVDAKGCPIDTDGDGVFDGIDRCPNTPSGVPVDAKGCPLDTDGDGVHDGIDKCPRTPKGAIVDATGCPKDSDGDGVWDGIDKCPGTPKGAAVDATGCPKDSDGDGVQDGIDKCPGTPKGAIVDATGCPKDSDGDGVWDGIDKCPGTPKGKRVDEKGCEVLFEEKRPTLVLEGVNFDFDSARLTAPAKAILDRVAMSLVQWPEIRVEVAGHTDSIGSETYNQRLSQRRAEAVRTYLSGKGVAADRMTARGYGESRPVADNATKAGRDRNRRVELTKLN